MDFRSLPSWPRFFGVFAVQSAFLLAVLGWGVGFYGPPIYLAEVIARTGWSLEVVSTAVTVHFLVGAIVVANLPRVHARFGLSLTTIAGSVISAIGVFGWAIASQPWQLFVAALISGAGWVTMGAVTVNAIVARWYAAGRPAALAKAYNGASIGGVVFSPLWVALINTMGFAAASAAVGIVMIVVVVLISRMVLAKTPEMMGQSLDGGASLDTRAKASSTGLMHPGVQLKHSSAELERSSNSEPNAKSNAKSNVKPHSYRICTAALASIDLKRPSSDSKRPDRGRIECSKGALWRDRAFVTLAAGMALGLFAQTGLLAHLFKLLVPVMGAESAGFLMGGATACAIVGRVVAARVVDRVGDRRAVAAANYLIQALGASLLFIAQVDQVGLMVMGVALFGFGIGNATSLPPLVAQTDFAAKEVQRVVALIVAIAQGTYAFAPAVFGGLLSIGVMDGALSIGAQVTHFFAAAITIQVIAAAIYLAGRRHPTVIAR